MSRNQRLSRHTPQLTARLTPIARVLRTAATVLTGSTLLWPVAIPANPTGGQVVGGQAQIGNTANGGTVINQQSNAAIINWQNFSIGEGEYVVFNQPSVSAATLNRVIGNLPSEILGNLTANGRVFVINPQGVMFGANSRVDVGALVTSTGNISNEDFLAGKLKFSGDSTASIVNRGQISAANGGFVVLSADKVSNSGTISAPGGDVLLAAGRQLSLQLDPEGLVSYSVDAAAASAAAGVENFGDIIANGGAVVMAANVARELIGTAINNRGRVTANAIEQRGGEIFLVAQGGSIEQRGTLDASSVQGEGGTINIRSDRDILLASGSTTNAGGRDGGEAIAVAGQTLNYEQGASLSVADRGAGAGGFAELSGREVFIRNTVDLGNDGQLLIDPVDLVVSNGGGNILYTDLQSMLNSGNVTIEAENSVVFAAYGGFFGTSGGGTLIVNAGVPTVCVTPLCSPTPAAPTHAAGIFFDGASDTFSIYGGLQLTSTVAGSQIISLANLYSGYGGGISITAPGAIELAVVRAEYGGSISITSTNGSVDTGELYAGNDIGIIAASTITTDRISNVDDLRLTTTSGDVRTYLDFYNGNTVDIQSGGAAIVNGPNAQTYGAFKVTAAGDIELLTYLNVDDQPVLGDLSAGSIDILSTGGGITAGNLSASTLIDLKADGGSLTAGNLQISNGSAVPVTINARARDSIAAEQVSASSYGGAISVTVRANSGSGSGTATSELNLGDITLTSNGSSNGSATLLVSNAASGAGAGGDMRLGDISVNAGSSAAASATLTASGTIDAVNDGADTGISATVRGNTAALIVTSTAEDVVVDDIDVDGNTSASTELTALAGSVRSLSAFDGVSTIQTGSLSVKADSIDLSNDQTYDGEAYNDRTTNLIVGGGTATFGTDTPFVTLNIDDDPEIDAEPIPSPGIPLPAAPNAAFKSPNSVRLGNLAVSGANNDGYVYVAAPDVNVDSLTDLSGTVVPLAAFNYRPYNNTDGIGLADFTGDLQNHVLTYLLGGTGYSGDIDLFPPDLLVARDKSLGDANYILYTTGEISGDAPNYGTSTTGQVIVLKASVPLPTPTPTPVVTPTPTPVVTPTPTPVVTPTPTPVVTPTPTPVVTPTPTPVVTPTPTPVITPTPTPVVTPTPTPVVTPTPTPVVTPTPTPMADMTEIITAIAEAPKIDDEFLKPTPVPKPGQGEIQRRDTSYEIGEFSCDATGV